MINILFIGFSVTEEKQGYIKYLKEHFNKSTKINIEEKAIGGITFELLPYILSDLINKQYDFVFYEIATCLRFFNCTSDYINLLGELEKQTLLKGCQPCFLNLYRNNIDYSDDKLSTSIEFFAKNSGYLFLNLINKINKNNEREFLRDGIHTNDLGAKLYFDDIRVFIEANIMNKETLTSTKKFLKVTDLCNEALGKFTRGGVEFSYLEVYEKQQVNLEFNSQVEVHGVVYLKDPFSGVFKIELDEKSFVRNIHAFDEFSYYSRYACQFIPKTRAHKVCITQSDIIPDVKLAKGEYNGKPRSAKIIGFMVV
jgi:hypothetical protein